MTDDVSIIEALGEPVKLTLGEYTNIKLTTPDDFAVAEQVLRARGVPDLTSLPISASPSTTTTALPAGNFLSASKAVGDTNYPCSSERYRQSLERKTLERKTGG